MFILLFYLFLVNLFFKKNYLLYLIKKCNYRSVMRVEKSNNFFKKNSLIALREIKLIFIRFQRSPFLNCF